MYIPPIVFVAVRECALTRRRKTALMKARMRIPRSSRTPSRMTAKAHRGMPRLSSKLLVVLMQAAERQMTKSRFSTSEQRVQFFNQERLVERINEAVIRHVIVNPLFFYRPIPQNCIVEFPHNP